MDRLGQICSHIEILSFFYFLKKTVKMDNDENSNYRKSLLPHVFGLLVIFGRFGGDFGRKNDDFGEKLPFWEILAFF